MIFCTEYVKGNMRYRFHPNFGDNSHFYDQMLVHCDAGNDYSCKLIGSIPEEYNELEGYQLFVYEGNGKQMKVQFYFKITSCFPV